MRAYSFDGVPIVGTSNLIPVTAMIDADSWSVGEHGEQSWDNSDVSQTHWDEQYTEELDGLALFLDEYGEKHTGDKIVVIDDETKAAWDAWIHAVETDESDLSKEDYEMLVVNKEDEHDQDAVNATYADLKDGAGE
jgi:hypothetical protein